MKYSIHGAYSLKRKSDITKALLIEEAREEFMENGFTPKFRRMQERIKNRK